LYKITIFDEGSNGDKIIKRIQFLLPNTDINVLSDWDINLNRDDIYLIKYDDKIDNHIKIPVEINAVCFYERATRTIDISSILPYENAGTIEPFNKVAKTAKSTLAGRKMGLYDTMELPCYCGIRSDKGIPVLSASDDYFGVLDFMPYGGRNHHLLVCTSVLTPSVYTNNEHASLLLSAMLQKFATPIEKESSETAKFPIRIEPPLLLPFAIIGRLNAHEIELRNAHQKIKAIHLLEMPFEDWISFLEKNDVLRMEKSQIVLSEHYQNEIDSLKELILDLLKRLEGQYATALQSIV